MALSTSPSSPPALVVPAMRLGYFARGVTYLIIGALALLAAWTGREAEGTREALETLRGYPWGEIMLWALAVGFLAYAVWRGLAAWYDLENHGTGMKGTVARGGLLVSALIHLGLMVSAARVAMGAGGGEDGDKPRSAASWLLTLPYGGWIIVGIGAVVVGAGVYQGYKGLSGKYKRHLRLTPWTERLEPVAKAGLLAKGVILGLVGGFFVYAGLTADPDHAGGIGEALQSVRSQPYGMGLLTVLALGTVAFALFCWIEAIYRVVPRCAGPDVRVMTGTPVRQAAG